MSSGTIAGGFFRLLPLFRAINQSIIEKSLSDKHWHADETGWKVFEALEGKTNNRWFLWIFRSNSTAVFIADPSRSAQVVEQFFGKKSKGIISCDRYRAYFCFVSKTQERFLIAYCWAHVRRDFLSIAKDRIEHEAWAMNWVFKIRRLYHINNRRIQSTKNSLAFLTHEKSLKEELSALKKEMNKELENKELATPCRKALESLKRHWNGLTTFVEHPDVPMDNNAAERGLRGGVIGRKNYYGSGSVRSAEFSAIVFSVIQTLLIWNINPQVWFSSFFDFMGSGWSKNFDQYLPWNMSSEKRAELSLKRGYDPPS